MATYDTSDIRKGLKVMMDSSPYTVVEFQFIKPGKGAAFTRTKFKNLLSGAAKWTCGRLRLYGRRSPSVIWWPCGLST